MTLASTDLRQEHEGILFGLQILEAMDRQIQAGQPVETGDLQQMIQFLRLFADKCHHGKEEGLYFPSLAAAGVPTERGPIGQMLLEHEQGRALIRQMARAAGDPVSRQAFAQAADGYIQLLRAHIDKENQVLFMLGDQMIPAAEQDRLLAEFASFEETVMGAGTHEQLHQMLDLFEKKYLA